MKDSHGEEVARGRQWPQKGPNPKGGTVRPIKLTTQVLREGGKKQQPQVCFFFSQGLPPFFLFLKKKLLEKHKITSFVYLKIQKFYLWHSLHPNKTCFAFFFFLTLIMSCIHLQGIQSPGEKIKLAQKYRFLFLVLGWF